MKEKRIEKENKEHKQRKNKRKSKTKIIVNIEMLLKYLFL
jgi:hypothetical protein